MTFEEIENAISHASSSLVLLHKQISTYFSALPDPSFVIDANGNYLAVLGGNARDLYSDPSHLEGKNLQEVFNSELLMFFSSTIASVLESGKMEVVEYQLGQSDLISNEPIIKNWYEGRVAPIPTTNDEKKAVIWLAINISAKKKAEEELRALADKDPLTGAYNRRYFDNLAMKEFSRYKRHKTVFSLAYFDIDHFKSVNDKYGHDIGDAVLKHLFGLISSQLRVNDLLARFGGEEFVLLLPNTNDDEAMILVERLRELIAATPLDIEDKVIAITVSIGVSQIVESDFNHQALIQKADKALYVSKRRGRNQTNVYRRED